MLINRNKFEIAEVLIKPPVPTLTEQDKENVPGKKKEKKRFFKKKESV